MIPRELMGILWLALFALVAAGEEAFECPTDLSIYRSTTISKEFNSKKLSGMWYEIAFHDAAQIKETCQSYYRLVSDLGENMEEHFGFTYPGREPSSLKLQVEFDKNELGLYQRYVDAPLVRKLKFPSVVVDVTESRDGQRYETVSEFLCYSIGPVSYREIRIGSRSPSMSDSQLLHLENVMRSLGVPFKALRRAVQDSNCTYVQR